MNPFQIELRNLPAEGVHREGTLPAAFFALPETDPVRPISPVTYSLDIVRDDDEIIAQGEVSAGRAVATAASPAEEGYFAAGATETPRAPVFSIARATSPDAFASSTTRRR